MLPTPNPNIPLSNHGTAYGYVRTFILKEIENGRRWYVQDGNNLFFTNDVVNPWQQLAPDKFLLRTGTNQPETRWPHIHINYSYQDELLHVHAKNRNGLRIDLFSNGLWRPENFHILETSLQPVVQAIRSFWSNPTSYYVNTYRT